MNIAIISDVHGNHLALKAVLQEASRLRVEHLLILGDMVGYYYHPDKVLRQLESWSYDWIQGNHERILKALYENKINNEQIRKKYGSGIQFALEKLSKEQIEELIELPVNHLVHIDGISLLMCHGSPWDEDLYIYPDTEESILRRCAETEANYVFLGHSHYPFVYQHNNVTVVNTGSVGQARDQGGAASWAMLDTSNRVIVMKKTTYDPGPIIDEVKRIDPHLPYLHQVLVRNN